MDTATPANLADLGGVWQRSLLITADGHRDETGRVWWLQLGAVCGDIRAPAGAARAETAFAGVLLQQDDVFTWRPDIAQGSLTNGAPDAGRLCFEGDILREDGVHSPYLEHWRRLVPAGPGDCAIGFRDASAAQPGFVIRIGALVLVARPHAQAAPSFLLASLEAGGARVVIGLGCDARPGDPVGLPAFDAGTLAFAAGPTGPAARYPAQVLHTVSPTAESGA